MKRLAVRVYGGAVICAFFFVAPEARRQPGLACIPKKGKKGGLVSQGDFVWVLNQEAISGDPDILLPTGEPPCLFSPQGAVCDY
jgi:hypothetical protein